MNVFNKVTLQGLKKSRTRTAVTIIGVILSAAMITAVTTFISSMQNYMVQNVIASDGDWHVEFTDVDYSFTERLKSDKEVSNMAVTGDVGYARLEGGINEYKPYLFVTAFSDEAIKTIPLRILSGRMPENSSELLISEHVESNGGVRYSIGDQITLELGRREIDGEKLNQSNPYLKTEDDIQETFAKDGTKTYTVVGICTRPGFEPYSAAGYSVITKLDSSESSGTFNAFVKLNNPRSVYEYAEKTADGAGYTLNSDLLRFQGVSNNDSFNTVLYSLGAILISLIMVGSVLLIHNAFSISVSERTRQFGILSSVGATKKQLRKSVLFEGFCIGAVGIPLGILLGIGGIGVTFLFIGGIFDKMSSRGVSLTLSVSMASVIIAAVVGIVTIMVSAYIPAKKAAKLSAIDAIRQTADIKIKAKKVKTSKLIGKLFGLEGMLALKNFKRNKKRYRSTVISLFVSVVLFISASAFGMYLQQGTGTAITDSGFDISFSPNSLSEEKFLNLYEQMKNVSDITDSGYQKADVLKTDYPAGRTTEKYKEYRRSAGFEHDYITIVCIDDKAYENYVLALGLNTKEYNGSDLSKTIASAKISGYDYDSNRFQSFDIFAGTSSIPLTLSGGNAETAGDFISQKITISHITDKAPENIYWQKEAGLTVFLPYSAADLFMSKSTSSAQMIFSSDNPSKSVDEMKKILKQSSISTDYSIYNVAETQEMNRNILLVVNVFTYGFIILISLITIANVFNTVSTNINLRRREFAMLKSVGMTDRGFNKMMNFECVFYGLKALLYGLPTAIIINYLIYKAMMAGVDVPFTLPWVSIGISVLSVFLVVFVTMLYSVSKVKKENTVDALKSDI